ncbi:MAG: glycosyl hydrolase 115 family protein [Oscillospiraceae bacterium]|nr:glycosyl hydrolase 115 family protein [Oscillospiraceae bacterium]
MKISKFKKAISFILAAVLLSPFIFTFNEPMAAADTASKAGIALPPVPDKGTKPADSDFVLVYDKAADLYVDSADWEGVKLALASLQSDIELVSGQKPDIKNNTSSLSDMAVIVGTIGKSAVIDDLINNAKIKLNVSGITGKWESYVIEIVENPVPGVSRALVIAGSDKRGTIYGIYKVSELIGVSPWVWWGDSMPERKGKLTFDGTLRIEQGEPSVKYRGIFLNDEAPSLSGWASKNFGSLKNSGASKGFDHEFYSHVFELLLRLKGNYLWPTMWNNSFHTDDPLNSELADTYGIVMGTSHQEHMTCADKEWSWDGKGDWNYFTNKDNIYNFWKNGVTVRKNYESVLTLGMRGQADTSILGANATLGDNMNLLADVLKDQRQIIKDVYGAENAAPQLLALYKEVEDFYYGDSTYGKLAVPDDVTLLLCDDNFGNVRTLPVPEMRNRSGGFGMYYHFDYRGGPISYQWINQIPLNKIWEQMTSAYDAGVDRIWIVNVGDLKPMELPIDYFLNLAYDYEKWSAPNLTDTFTREWAAREFGEKFADDAKDVLNGYTKILGARKAEVVLANPSTFSLTAFDEANRVIRAFENVVEKAEKIYNELPDYKKPAFYQLALYPARASMNVYKTGIYAAWSLFLAKENLPAANEYAKLAEAAFEADKADMEYYNKMLSSGKWDGIMRQNHIGYTTWNSPSNSVVADRMFDTGSVNPLDGSELAVRVQNSDVIIRGGKTELDDFSNLSQQNRYFDIFNGKALPFEFTVKSSADWVKISENSGVCISQKRIGVSVDWSKVKSDSSAIITVSGTGQSIEIAVNAEVFGEAVSPEKAYVETDGTISINPVNYAENTAVNAASWTVIDDYGRDNHFSSIKVLPNHRSFTESSAPFVEYDFYVQNEGEYNVNVFIAPTNNFVHQTITPLTQQLRFSVQIDSGEKQTANGLPSGFNVGGNAWSYSVMNNMRMTQTNHGSLSKGWHTLRIFAIDPGVVIQKIIVAPADAKQTTVGNSPQTYHFMDSYFGPPESFWAETSDVAKPYPELDAGIQQFTAKNVEITFEADGVVIEKVTASASNGSKLTSEQINAVKQPEKEGHDFAGWLTAGGTALTDQIIFTEAAAVTANFVSTDSAGITYYPNNGTAESHKTHAPKETAVVVENCTFSNDNKTFLRWNTKPDDSGDVYTPGVEYTAREPMVLHAIWTDDMSVTTFSSGLAGSLADKAFDGSQGTSWKTLGNGTEWVEIGLNGSYTLDGITVVFEGGADNIEAYQVETMASNGQWEQMASGTGSSIGESGELLFLQALPVTTNRIKFSFSAKNADTPVSVSEISLAPFINWGLAGNGGMITSVPDDGEGEPEVMNDGDRVDYNKRWRIDSKEGFTTPITLTLAESKNISVVNIFSITGLWNESPPDIKRDTTATSALGTIRNLTLEYTADGNEWLPLPNGKITNNQYSWISVQLDEPIAMTGVRFTVQAQGGSEFNDDWIRVVQFEALELVDTNGIIKLPELIDNDMSVAPTMTSGSDEDSETDNEKDGEKDDGFIIYIVIGLAVMAVVGVSAFVFLRMKKSKPVKPVQENAQPETKMQQNDIQQEESAPEEIQEENE